VLYLRLTDDVASLRVLVVVEGLFQARRVCRLLSTIGYAFFTNNAPSSENRALLAAQTHWPVFLVTPELFSGPAFDKFDIAFVFNSAPAVCDSYRLEVTMALEDCQKSFAVFPKTEDGLKTLSDTFGDVNSSLPFKV